MSCCGNGQWQYVLPPCPPNCPPALVPTVQNLNLAGLGLYASTVNGQIQFYGIEGDGTTTTVTLDATNNAVKVSGIVTGYIQNGKVNSLTDTTTIGLTGPNWVFQQDAGAITFSNAGIEMSEGTFQIDSGVTFQFNNGSILNFSPTATFNLGGSAVPALSVFMTDSTAGQLAPVLVSNFISTFNPVTGWSATTATPLRTLTDSSTLPNVISVLATLILDLKNKKLPHT